MYQKRGSALEENEAERGVPRFSAGPTVLYTAVSKDLIIHEVTLKGSPEWMKLGACCAPQWRKPVPGKGTECAKALRH